MQGTDFILRTLAADGIGNVFLVPGGLIDPFLPALARVPEVVPIIAAQEGGAAYMADGYARASGKFGVCLCIGGPGLTNTVTALSAALTDQSPVLVLSGEVSNAMQGMGLFQDATAGTYDDGRIVAPVTAQSYSVPDVRLLGHKLRGAIKRMLDHGRAPVHLSVSHDIQTGSIDAPIQPLADDILCSRPLDVEAAEGLWRTLRDAGEAPRVALLVGGGMIADDCAVDLLAAAERFHLPVATTEHAKGLFPEDHELSLGVFGYAGTRHATQALIKEPLDLLIVLGATLNVRDSMHWSAKLAPRLGLVSVNISAVHVGCHFDRDAFIGGHAGAFVRWLARAPEDAAKPLSAGVAARRQWLKGVRTLPRYYDVINTASENEPIHPARMIAACRKVMPRNTIAIVDSGAHRAFAVHYWDSYGPREFLTASGLGPMGWGIPAGIGAKAARPDAPVVVFTGDGCMRMHGLEVQSAVRAGLAVIFVVSNNAALGNVWLRMHTQGALPAHLTEAPDQDWAGLARALGCDGQTVRKPAELSPAFERALASGRPFVIDVKTDKTATTPVEPYSEATATWSYHA
jgi:acetolactate synthase I/II/III large subunit